MTVTFKDQGIITKIIPHTERKALLTIFSREHGLIKGMVTKTKRLTIDLGYCLEFRYQARLEDQLGFLAIDQYNILLTAMPRMIYLSKLMNLLGKILPENHPYPVLYEALYELLQHRLAKSLGHYIWFFELLMQHLGFELSLDQCAVTGGRENLVYLSPKTGRCVSYEVGRPYHSKLLELPQFMVKQDYEGVSKEDFTKAMAIFQYFITRHFSWGGRKTRSLGGDIPHQACHA